MGDLVLVFANGAYELQIMNVEVGGAISLVSTADDAAAGVKVLAESMAQGVDAIVANSGFIFDIGGEMTTEGVIQIFSSVDTILTAEGVGIFAATEGESLLEALAAAGEALLEFLAIA
jgi:hypothetical protein